MRTEGREIAKVTEDRVISGTRNMLDVRSPVGGMTFPMGGTECLVGTAARDTTNLLFLEVALLSDFVELRFRVRDSIEVGRSSLASC